MSRTAVLLAAALTTLSCATTPGGRPDDSLSASRVIAELSALGAPAPEKDLVHIERLRLEVLAQDAAVVTVDGRAMPVRAVFVRTGGHWTPAWLDGSRVDESLLHTSLLLRPGKLPSLGQLASDLLRVYEDPDPQYALLLRSKDGIPLSRRNSDYLRDLERRGLGPDERRTEMLRRVDFPIVEPQYKTGSSRDFTFFSWSYFGGAVKRWSARTDGERVRIVNVETLASEVGSYDLFP